MCIRGAYHYSSRKWTNCGSFGKSESSYLLVWLSLNNTKNPRDDPKRGRKFGRAHHARSKKEGSKEKGWKRESLETIGKTRVYCSPVLSYQLLYFIICPFYQRSTFCTRGNHGCVGPPEPRGMKGERDESRQAILLLEPDPLKPYQFCVEKTLTLLIKLPTHVKSR